MQHKEYQWRDVKGPKLNIDEAAQIEFCEFPRGFRPCENKGDCTFDVQAARRACEMGPRYFKHSRGRLGGKPLALEVWQTNIIGTLFGWKRSDGLRRFRNCYIEVGRGNGKSTMCAIIAGLLIYLDDEPGAEVIGAAASRDQAREVFNVFKMSVAMSATLNRISKIYQSSIVRVDAKTGLDRAVYKVASAEAGTAHGVSAHGVIFDELHAQPNRDLWDVLESSRLKRDQPLTVAITTAGHDRQSICWEQREYAENVASGAVDDVAFLPVIYAADVADDWTEPATWYKANPNLGVSLKLEDMQAACNKAKTSPGYTNTFKRLHLNIWTELESLAIPMEDWDRCTPLGDETAIEWRERMLEELQGEHCYAGLDLASKVDVAALVLWFPIQRVALPWFWVPSEAAKRRGADPSNRGRYERWIAEGFMESCPGVRIEQAAIKFKILELRWQFVIADIAYDKWNAEALRQELEAEGVSVSEFGQTIGNFTDATKELIASVCDHSVDHGHNPVMRWMASNLSVYSDANENMRPDKKHSADKIDGMVAWLMAMSVSTEQVSNPRVSSW